MTIEIKSLSNKYVNQVKDLVLNIQKNEFNISISIEDQPDLLAIEEFYFSNGGNFFGAFADGELVGTIALVKCEDESGAIRKMFVKKEFRGKEFNIAQKLFDFVTEYSRKNGITRLYLGTVSVLKAAQRFYERNGFEVLEKSQLPAEFPIMGSDDIFFSIRLD